MKRRIIFLVTILFIFTSQLVFADSVFVDKKTKEYHKISCKLIRHRGDLKEEEKDQAVKEKYKPCGECYKEEIKKDKAERL